MNVECSRSLGVTTKVFLAGIQSQDKWHKFIFIIELNALTALKLVRVCHLGNEL